MKFMNPISIWFSANASSPYGFTALKSKIPNYKFLPWVYINEKHSMVIIFYNQEVIQVYIPHKKFL